MKTISTQRQPAKASELPTLMAIDDVAEHLGVTVRHVRRLVAERRIPFLKWGRLLRFDPGELNVWLERRRTDIRWPQ
jgi:excisionase family DNA binding protein